VLDLVSDQSFLPQFRQHVERLNEHSLEDYLGWQRTTAIYIVDGWKCWDSAGIALVSTLPPKPSTPFCPESSSVLQLINAIINVIIHRDEEQLCSDPEVEGMDLWLGLYP
jgi:hypothetical protein